MAALDAVMADTELDRLLDVLPPGPGDQAITDPFALIVLETAGYLADDERRAEVFARLKSATALSPARVAAEPELEAILAPGGMHPKVRAERLRRISSTVADRFAGDLSGGLSGLPAGHARRFLLSLPSVGEPLADKILLFSGIDPRPALDSNGLRVMVRLGLVKERTSWSTTYREAMALIAREGRGEREWLMRLWFTLRAHGRAVCRRSAPLCLACPLEPECPKTPIRAL